MSVRPRRGLRKPTEQEIDNSANLVVEVNLVLLEQASITHKGIWETLPDALLQVGFAAAEAGALEGDVRFPTKNGDGAKIGSWRIE